MKDNNGNATSADIVRIQTDDDSILPEPGEEFVLTSYIQELTEYPGADRTRPGLSRGGIPDTPRRPGWYGEDHARLPRRRETRQTGQPHPWG